MSSFYLPHRDILSLTKHKNKIDDLIEKKTATKNGCQGARTCGKWSRTKFRDKVFGVLRE